MSTALDLCTTALKISGALGVGQSAAAEDVNDALAALVRMLNLWQSRRWLVPALAEVVIPCTGQLSYTVGPGGNVNVPRPDLIDDAFVRLVNPAATSGTVDYPLTIISSRNGYNEITLKALVAWPSAIYYSPSSPLGQLFIWPVPSANYEVHIFIKAALANFAALSTPFTLPAEYEEAILYNLVGRLCIIYGLPVRPDVAQLAQAGENTIRNANAQISELELPSGFMGGRGHGWQGGGYGGTFAVAPGTPGSYPTSPAGLAIGAIWNNGGVLSIVGGGGLPTSPAGLAVGSLWNNGGVVCIV